VLLLDLVGNERLRREIFNRRLTRTAVLALPLAFARLA